MKGIITEIQRFSLHDGPGIRTTVFFKGCNLHCAWCHNPETIRTVAELLYYREKCIGCLQCIRVCPTGAHRELDGKHLFEKTLCSHCGRCAAVCFAGSLVLAGREMETDEVLPQIVADLAYYRRSGGGVTLSGGEIMLQAEFAADLLRLCQKNHIHTAIETNAASSWEIMKQLLPVTDLVMADLKMTDDDAHRKWTGASNALILENLVQLSREPVPLIIRTPLIPGVNDSAGAIRQISRFISGFPNLLYYELLQFNPLGDGKYSAMGMENRFRNVAATVEDQVNYLAQAARESGIPVKVG